MTLERLLPCLLLAASCSSSKGPADAAATDARVDIGVDAGGRFSDGMSKVLNASGLEFDGPSTAAMLTSYGAACAHATAKAGVVGAKILFFGLADVGADGKSAAIGGPGTYSIFAGTAVPASSHSAEAFISDLDTSCLPANEVRATSGSITITTANTSGLEGSYALVFPAVGQISGPFVAPACDGFDPNSSVVTTCGVE